MAKSLREQLEALDEAEIDAAAKRVAEREPPSPNRGEGMMDAVKGAGGKILNKALDPLGLGKLVDMVPTAEENNTWGGTAARTAVGAAKGASFGTLGTGLAALDEVQGRIAGTDDLSFGERRADRNEEVNAKSNLGGEIAGSIVGAPGKIAMAGAKAIESTPALAKHLLARGKAAFAARTVTSMGAGGLDAFAYSVAEGQDLGAAGYNAMFGAAGGAAMQPISEGVAWLGKVLSPAVGAGKGREVSDAILNKIKNKYGDEFMEEVYGRERLNVDRITAEMQREGETLTELFPDSLAATVRDVSKSADDKVEAAVQPLMNYFVNMKKAALPQFRQAVGEAIGSADVRNIDDVLNATRETRNQLIPAYDAAFKNAVSSPSGKARPISVPKLKEQVSGIFKDSKFAYAKDLEKKLLAQLPDSYKQTKRGRRAEVLTPRQLLEFRQILDNVIYSGNLPAAGDIAASSIDKTAVRKYLLPARDKVKAMLYKQVPDLKQVDAKYADEVQLRHSFEAGEAAFRGKGDKAFSKFETFTATTDRNPQELAAFMEGYKGRLIDDIMSKRSEGAVRGYVEANPGKFDFLEQVVDRDAVDAIKNQVERYAMVNQITKGVSNESGSAFVPTSGIPASIGEGLLALGASTGALSASLGAGALKRSLTGAKASHAGAQGSAQAINNVLLPPANAGAKMINEELAKDLPTLLRGTAAFSPLAAGASGNQ